MSSKQTQILYDGITGIREDIIEDAQSFLPKKKIKSWVKWSAAAACLCLVVWGVYGAVQRSRNDKIGYSSNGNGGGEGSTYMSYAGPVFPLSVLSGGDSLMAERNVNYDFSPYKTYASKSIVTDSYVLTNPEQEEQRATLVYPFAASLSKKLEVLPKITVDGETVQATLHVGPYSGGYEGAYSVGADVTQTLNLAELDSWEKYRLLLNTGYQDRAFDAFPELTQPVVVYEISDMYGEASEDVTAPSLNMEFTIDYAKTVILTYGFNGGENDRSTDYCARSLFIPSKDSIGYGERAYLIVLGDDIGEYALKAYVDGACEKEMENAGGRVTRYETTLGDVFATAAKQYLSVYGYAVYEENTNILSTIPKEDFIGLAAELLFDHGILADDPAMRYDQGMLEDMFSESRHMGRVMYLTFDVVLPAGGSVEVTAEMVKNASIDFIGDGKDRNGYDMVTRLGSSLIFTSQTASVSNTEDIEILSQDFGFDLEKGVDKVALDPAKEHYYLEVRKRDSSY